jgi:hypothetical protein
VRAPSRSTAAPVRLARFARFARFAPLVVATIAVARAAIGGVLAKLGHPGAALDDAYIHFQYARAFAEGHPFRFQAGEPISTGATSFAWPLVLAAPYAAGLRGESILWAAWTLSFVALGALAYEAYALAKPLAGGAAAIGAGAMTLFFGGLVWGAASGMEVVPFAWLVAHATRRAAEWAEDPSRRTRRRALLLLALAFAAPFVRPEGAITSCVLGVAVLLHPLRSAAGSGSASGSGGSRSEPSAAPPASAARRAGARAFALAFVVAAIAPNLVVYALTGHGSTSTAQVKLLWGNPYYDFGAATLANARTLVSQILDGEVWSAEFLPSGGAPIACAGLAALAWRGSAAGKAFRAGALLVLALSMFVPCTYVTFLWNRLRYLWPFAPAWFVGLACLARVLGSFVGRFLDARAGVATTALLAGGVAGALLVRLDWVLEDVAHSASGIDRQQVALGRWADATLPKGARVGVNDTGAIAYFGNRRTFDVVGLTTPTEGRYWVAGAASRYEHYERLHRTAPALLPTHFIVYPEWMGCEPVLGRMLHEAVVTDASILGGAAMRAYEARWDHLGSGDAPWTATSPPLARVVDELDVADLESERAHAYDLAGAREGEEAVEEGNAPAGAVVVDGGRTNRAVDRFTIHTPPPARPLRGIARVEARDPGTTLVVRAAGAVVARVPVPDGPWTEIVFDLPADPAPTKRIEVTAEGPAVTSFHYWFGD